MDNVIANKWWAVALRGVLAVLFGVLAAFMPTLALLSLVLLFGAYCLVDGVFAIVSGIRHHKDTSHWWVLVLEGLVGVVVGILTFAFPPATALVLVYFVASWAIVTGLLEVAAAIRLRKEIAGEWLLALAGIVSIILGVFMAIFPGVAAVAIVWLIAAYAILFGLIMLGLAFKLRGWQHRGSTMPSAPRAS